MKMLKVLTLALAITVVIGAQSAMASAVASLIVTETSSTDNLTLSYSGPDAGAFTATRTGTDTWTIQINPVGPISINNFSNDWAEPEDLTQTIINEVFHSTEGINSDKIFVRSDLNIAQDNNGIVSADNTSFLIGSDSGVQIFLTFHDVAAANEASVPDTGSTLGLLTLSSIALLGISRLRPLRST